MEDRYSNDVETAAKLEQHRAVPDYTDLIPDLDDDFVCAYCGRPLLASEVNACIRCEPDQ